MTRDRRSGRPGTVQYFVSMLPRKAMLSKRSQDGKSHDFDPALTLTTETSSPKWVSSAARLLTGPPDTNL